MNNMNFGNFKPKQRTFGVINNETTRQTTITSLLKGEQDSSISKLEKPVASVRPLCGSGKAEKSNLKESCVLNLERNVIDNEDLRKHRSTLQDEPEKDEAVLEAINAVTESQETFIDFSELYADTTDENHSRNIADLFDSDNESVVFESQNEKRCSQVSSKPEKNSQSPSLLQKCSTPFLNKSASNIELSPWEITASSEDDSKRPSRNNTRDVGNLLYSTANSSKANHSRSEYVDSEHSGNSKNTNIDTSNSVCVISSTSTTKSPKRDIFSPEKSKNVKEWLDEMCNNELLTPMDVNVSQSEVEQRLVCLKYCENNLLETVFQWFTNIPVHIVKDIPYISDPINLVSLKAFRRRLQAKVRQIESLHRTKLAEQMDDPYYTAISNVEKQTDMILKTVKHLVSKSCTSGEGENCEGYNDEKSLEEDFKSNSSRSSGDHRGKKYKRISIFDSDDDEVFSAVPDKDLMTSEKSKIKFGMLNISRQKPKLIESQKESDTQKLESAVLKWKNERRSRLIEDTDSDEEGVTTLKSKNSRNENMKPVKSIPKNTSIVLKQGLEKTLLNSSPKKPKIGIFGICEPSEESATQKLASAVSKWKQERLRLTSLDERTEDSCEVQHKKRKLTSGEENSKKHEIQPERSKLNCPEQRTPTKHKKLFTPMSIKLPDAPKIALSQKNADNLCSNSSVLAKEPVSVPTGSKFKIKTPTFGTGGTVCSLNAQKSSALQNDYVTGVEEQNTFLSRTKNVPQFNKEDSTLKKFSPPKKNRSTIDLTNVSNEDECYIIDDSRDEEEDERIKSKERNTVEPQPEMWAATNLLNGQVNDGGTSEFSKQDYPHSAELNKIFRQCFGLHKFRPNQLEAINAAMLGYDCFILMPTGGGKSLCYQLPALLSAGVTIVISPLKSLIVDQTEKLKSLDIPAAHLLGEATVSEMNSVYMQLMRKEPGIKMLYVTPEKIANSQQLKNAFTNLYQRNLISRFVIDEAHCVSQWGHDFRPDYKRLSTLRVNFPSVPMMVLTATATPRVRKDILHQLNIKNPKWFLSSFNRPNLQYQVVQKKGKSSLSEIIEIIKTRFARQSGILYCLTRKECDACAQTLCSEGIKAVSYHAGLSDTKRNDVQAKWVSNRVMVVCATIAFGMGIDKPDVRFVIHYSIPKSIEGYYQESGRAGRDSQKATCILFYTYHDMHRIRKLIEMGEGTPETKQVHISNLWRIVTFCENRTDCRRGMQLNYFGEQFNREYCISDSATACDNCQQMTTYKMQDVTEDCKAILKAVQEICGTIHNSSWSKNFTFTHIVDIFKGSVSKKVVTSGHDKHPLHGRGRQWDRVDVERLVHKLTIEGFLQEQLVANQAEIVVAYIKVGPRANELLSGKSKIMFPMTASQSKARSLGVTSVTGNKPEVNEEIKAIQERCYEALMDMCRAMAASLNIKASSIMTIQAIQMMSKMMPETEEDMLKIDGVTKANFDKYGKYMLEITQQFAVEKQQLHCDEEESADVANESFDWNCSESSPYFPESQNSIKYMGGKRPGGVYKKRKKGLAKGRGVRKYKKKKTSPKKKAKTVSSVKKSVGISSRIKAWSSAGSVRRPGFLSAPKVYQV